MGEDGGARWSRTTITAATGVGIVVFAALLFGAFQLGRVVERDDRSEARVDVTPLILDRESLALPRDGLLPGLQHELPTRTTPPVQDAAERFSVWVEPDGDSPIQRVFEADGQVLELHGQLTEAGAEDFRVLYLSTVQRATVADLVNGSGLLEEPTGLLGGYGDRSREIMISVSGHVRTVDIDTDGPPPDTDRTVGATTARIVTDLFDLTWLDPGIEAPPNRGRRRP